MSKHVVHGLALLVAGGCGDRGPSAPASPPAPPPVSAPPSSAQAEPAAPGESVSSDAPAWARSIEPRVPGFRAGSSTVPQVRDAATLYESATETPGPLGEGVLLCRVLLSHAREWDASGMFGRNVAPDVNVHVRWGDAHEERIPLAEDAYEGVFSLPVAHAPTASLAVRLVDRDLAADDRVTRFEIAAPVALPIVRSDDLATLRCRALPEAEAMRRARLGLAAAASKLAPLEARPHARTLDAEPDAMDRELVPVRAAIREAASYLGYAHPEVQALVERVDAVERAMLEKLAEAFDREAARASDGAVALGRDVSATVQGIDCAREGSAPARCVVEVAGEYARIPTPPGFVEPIAVRLYPRGARPIPCFEGGAPGSTPTFVRTAGRVEHSFTCMLDDGSAVPEGGWLVRLAERESRAFARPAR